MSKYALCLTNERILKLTQDGIPVPVNEPYLWRLAEESGFDLTPGEERAVDAKFANDAIEEALAQAGHEIALQLSLRKCLLAAYVSDGRPSAA